LRDRSTPVPGVRAATSDAVNGYAEPRSRLMIPRHSVFFAKLLGQPEDRCVIGSCHRQDMERGRPMVSPRAAPVAPTPEPQQAGSGQLTYFLINPVTLFGMRIPECFNTLRCYGGGRGR